MLELPLSEVAAAIDSMLVAIQRQMQAASTGFPVGAASGGHAVLTAPPHAMPPRQLHRVQRRSQHSMHTAQPSVPDIMLPRKALAAPQQHKRQTASQLATQHREAAR